MVNLLTAFYLSGKKMLVIMYLFNSIKALIYLCDLHKIVNNLSLYLLSFYMYKVRICDRFLSNIKLLLR